MMAMRSAERAKNALDEAQSLHKAA